MPTPNAGSSGPVLAESVSLAGVRETFTEADLSKCPRRQLTTPP
jgi:hypothetical protein